MNISSQIKTVKTSIVAVGVKINNDQLNIMGSGFCVINNSHILTAAHIIQNLSPEQMAGVGCMVATKDDGKIITYTWAGLELVDKQIENDAALFKLKNSELPTLLKPLDIDCTGKIEEGAYVYFMGFPYAANLIRDGFGITLITNTGMISSIKRKSANPNPLDWFIVDAISNPGNSGCPLIDINTNKVVGIMSIAFRIQSQVNPALDIREPMHIAGAKPISLIEEMLVSR